jgi:hypothetical protein
MQGTDRAVSNERGAVFWLSHACACCVSDGVPLRSFVVTLIVGTILNLINQGDALLNGGNVNLTKILLTYAVPYCVATYGAVSFRLAILKTNARIEDGKDRRTVN